MDFVDFFRAIFALALTLGLVGLAAVGLRRFGPDALSRFVPTRKERRMSVVETLVLDPSRRLVLIALDGEERLLLLGEGRALSPPGGRLSPDSAPDAAPDAARDPTDA
jgi:flagellar protein FliO/FliZ